MKNNSDNFSEEQFLPDMDRKNSFIAPEGYFEALSSRLMCRLEVEEEIQQYQILAGIERKLKFAVPQNYFVDLESILEYKYEQYTYTELSKVPKQGFSSPSPDYFSGLENKLMNRIELEIELNEFKTLSSIEKKNSFLITPDYFDKNAQIVTEKHTEAKHAPAGIVKQLRATIFNPKMAIAASFALLLGLSAVWYFSKDHSAIQTGDCKTLACLEKHELLNDKNIHEFSEESLYDMVDIDELDKIISEDDTSIDSIKKDKKE